MASIAPRCATTPATRIRLPRPAPLTQALLLALPLFAGSGCVTVYHPLSGLHAPVVVDPEVGNLPDLRIVLHCVPRDILKEKAGVFCQHVQQLFENQGAEVHTVTSVTRTAADGEFRAPAPATPPGGAKESPGAPAEGTTKVKKPPALPPHLIVELRARHLMERTHWTMWTLSMFTLTLAPGISENIFVQEVVIRDATGNLLVSGELKGRIVRYFGLGYWLSTKLVNLIARDDDEDLNDGRLKEVLSADLYGQLSQMVFNANMRRRVLGATVTQGGDS